jgi:RNA polymerase sigma-70 factor (ECF subfamily)
MKSVVGVSGEGLSRQAQEEADAPTAPARPSAWLADAFRAHAPFVANTLRRFGVAATDVPDQLQETFLVVHRIESTYDPDRPIRPWLYGIAYRVAARYRQARGRGLATGDLEESELAAADPLADAALERKEAQALVLEALERIELSRRAVFILADIEGEAAPTIAEALEIPLNTAYSRLRLAREEFAKAVTMLQKRRSARGGPGAATGGGTRHE